MLRIGHFATRQTKAALSCEGAFPLLEQRSYQQVMGHMIVLTGRASATFVHGTMGTGT
jgi:hypothetical protein